MKTIAFDNLPAGSIVLVKRYTLWQRLKAWITKKQLKYNDVFIDPFGKAFFIFSNTFWEKNNVYTFSPKKPYSKKESSRLTALLISTFQNDSNEVERLLLINLIRPNTFNGITLEELLDENRFYTKKQIA